MKTRGTLALSDSVREAITSANEIATAHNMWVVVAVSVDCLGIFAHHRAFFMTREEARLYSDAVRSYMEKNGWSFLVFINGHFQGGGDNGELANRFFLK